MVRTVNGTTANIPLEWSDRTRRAILDVDATLCLIDIVRENSVRRAGVGGTAVRAAPDLWSPWIGRERLRPEWMARMLESPRIHVHGTDDATWWAGFCSPRERGTLQALRVQRGVSVPFRCGDVPCGIVTVLTGVEAPNEASAARSLARTLAALLEVDAAAGPSVSVAEVREATLASVAHELRNALHAAYTGSQILMQMPLSPQQERRHIRMIEAASLRMSSILDDALELATLQMETRDAEPASSSTLDEAVSVALKDIGELRQASDVRVSGLRAIARGVRVSVSAKRLGRALASVLRHVIERVEAGETVQLDSTSDAACTRITVSVEGLHSRPEDVDAQFTWGWLPRHLRQSGSLRLALAKRLLDSVGGDIGCTDSSTGCRFHIEIPNAPPYSLDPDLGKH